MDSSPKTLENSPLLVLRAGVFLLVAGALLPSTTPAEGLRLSDVLTTQTMNLNPQEGLVRGEFARRLVDDLRADLEAKRLKGLEEKTDKLLARLAPEDAAVADTMYLRVQILSALGKHHQALISVQEYLETYPDGADRFAALGMVAKANLEKGDWSEAYRIYHQLAKDCPASELHDALGIDGTWNAVEVMINEGDGKSARRVLEAIPERKMTRGVQSLYTYWRTESLLAEDDSNVPFPPRLDENDPLYPSVELRRAMLFELRGVGHFAAPIYQELGWAREKLSPAEQTVLETRIQAREKRFSGMP